MTAKFITFEGCEGSGKSTQASLLHKAFINSNIESILTREPGGTDSAEVIRNLLLHGESKFHPITELLLHNASRYEHAKNLIIPALKARKTVICDRFVDSTMAYQGYGHKIGKKLPALLHNVLMEGLAPNITFILDIDPKEGLERAKTKSNHDNYEKLGIEFHTRVRNGFLDIANMAKDRCTLIKPNKDILNIHKEIINIVNSSTGLDLKPLQTI
jgi:dTMP kinase